MVQMNFRRNILPCSDDNRPQNNLSARANSTPLQNRAHDLSLVPPGSAVAMPLHTIVDPVHNLLAGFQAASLQRMLSENTSISASASRATSLHCLPQDRPPRAGLAREIHTNLQELSQPNMLFMQRLRQQPIVPTASRVILGEALAAQARIAEITRVPLQESTDFVLPFDSLPQHLMPTSHVAQFLTHSVLERRTPQSFHGNTAGMASSLRFDGINLLHHSEVPPREQRLLSLEQAEKGSVETGRATSNIGTKTRKRVTDIPAARVETHARGYNAFIPREVVAFNGASRSPSASSTEQEKFPSNRRGVIRPLQDVLGREASETKRKKAKRKPTHPEPPGIVLTNRPPICLAVDSDESTLSPYQCFLRKQIELFETKPDQVGGKAQGRNTPIVVGQVGIRCRHCAKADSNSRSRGSMLYSQSLSGIYQIAQNMAKTHWLSGRCTNMPTELREQLCRLQKSLNRGSGGKDYWKKAAKSLGVSEDGNILKFTTEAPTAPQPRTSQQS